MRYDVLLVDGPYLAYRSYTAPYKLSTLSGRDSTMIQTFFNILLSVKRKHNPKQIAIAWESHNTPSWRRDISPSYKPKRVLNNDFIEQLNDIKKLLNLLNIKQFYASYNEADDVIATLTHNTEKSVLILTVDKDIMQLTSDINKHHILCNNIIMTEDDVIKKFDVQPYQIPDYLALVGDTADNIEGVKGIGKKKASKILQEYGSILVIEPDILSDNDLQKVHINRKLTLLNYDANVQLLFENETINESIDDILRKYELIQLKKRKEELIKLQEM